MLNRMRMTSYAKFGNTHQQIIAAESKYISKLTRTELLISSSPKVQVAALNSEYISEEEIEFVAKSRVHHLARPQAIAKVTNPEVLTSIITGKMFNSGDAEAIAVNINAPSETIISTCEALINGHRESTLSYGNSHICGILLGSVSLTQEHVDYLVSKFVESRRAKSHFCDRCEEVFLKNSRINPESLMCIMDDAERLNSLNDYEANSPATEQLMRNYLKSNDAEMDEDMPRSYVVQLAMLMFSDSELKKKLDESDEQV